MFSVMNNNDIRKNIWSYLRSIPEPLNTTAKIIYKKDDNPSFGDIYQDEINKLQEKIDLYNQTDEDIKKINDKIATLQSDITQLNLDITTCTDKNGNFQDAITTLDGTITQQGLDIKNLQEKIDNNIGCPSIYVAPAPSQ